MPDVFKSSKYLAWPLAGLFGMLMLPASALATISYSSTYTATVDTSQISTPRGLKILSDGTMYVLGTSTTKMAKLSADGSTSQIITFGTALPSTPIAFTASGNSLYLAINGSQIVKHTVSGTVTTLGASGTLASSSTTDVAFRPDGTLFATKNFTLYTLDTNLQPIVSSQALVVAANRIATDTAGNLYYLNNGTRRIRKVTFTGSTILADSPLISLTSGIASPKALYVSADGSIYFADATTTPFIKKYSSGGTLLWTYTNTSGAGSLSGMQGMTIDGNGTVYIINSSGVVKVYPDVDPVTGLTTSVAGGNVTLNWTNPTSANFASVTIRRSSTGYPTSVTDGSAVASGITGTTYTDAVPADAFYYYSVFVHNTLGLDGGAANATAFVDTNRDDIYLPYAYWPLEAIGTPLAADLSGNGFNGTAFTGAPSLSSDVPGTTGFDGTAHSFTDTHSYSFSGSLQDLQVSRPVQDDFTLCAWFKTTSVGANTPHYQTMPLFDSEVGGVGNDFGFGVDSNGQMAFGDGQAGAGDTTIHGTSLVNTGNWTHVCGTRRKVTGELKIYVNGALEATGIGSLSSLNGNGTMIMGNGTDGGIPWRGNIDDIRVYNTVLSADDVAALAAVFKAPVSSSSSSSSSEQPQSSGSHRGSSNAAPRPISLTTRYSAVPVAAPSSKPPVVSAPIIPKSPAPAPVAPVSSPVSSPLGTTVPKVLASMELRTCHRVEKLFSGNQKMKDRVNTRLEKTFGFSCD